MNNINHLAIIVDGNGRWAKERGLSRSEGHKAGAKALENIIMYISKKKIAHYLSLYIFSTENFSRSKEEVDNLMKLFITYFKTSKKKYANENIKVIFSGEKSFLKKDVRDAIENVEESTSNNTGLVVNFCLSYGGRQELVTAVKNIAKKVKMGKIAIEDIDEEVIEDNLYNKLPDVDYLIRTSGEKRISNFMLWQISYAELYFPKVYFPDFNEEVLEEALAEYQKRDRRFGNVK